MRNPLRHQLASTSPIPVRGLVRAALSRSTAAAGRLRDRLRVEYGAADVVLTGSGTQALALALALAEDLAGDHRPVLLPAFSCFDVASAAVLHGRPVFFYDVDPLSFGPDPESLERVLRPSGGTVVIASLYGVPLDWTRLDPLLEAAGAFLVEDAAQGHGARWRGEPLGAHGRLGVLSFGRGKGWTGGGGGALIIRDPADAERVRPRLERPASAASVLARSTAHWMLGRPGLYGVPRALPGLGLGETRYNALTAVRGCPEAAANLALESRSLSDAWGASRKSAAVAYAAHLARRDDLLVPTVPEGATAGYIRFGIVTSAGMDAFDDPRRARRLGAAPGYPLPLPRLPQIAHLTTTVRGHTHSGADLLSERLVTLPTHPLVSSAEREELLRLLGRG